MSRCFQRMKERLSTLGWTTEAYLSYGSGGGEDVSIPSTSLYTMDWLVVRVEGRGRAALPVIAQLELVPFRVVDLRSVRIDMLRAGALPPYGLVATAFSILVALSLSLAKSDDDPPKRAEPKEMLIKSFEERILRLAIPISESRQFLSLNFTLRAF